MIDGDTSHCLIRINITNNINIISIFSAKMSAGNGIKQLLSIYY